MNREIDAAIEVLKRGGIILYPTDTVWGIGCDATNEEAVERVFKLKERAGSKSLITLASDIDMVCRYVEEMPEIAVSLIEVNDKPMTIIYPNATGLAKNVIAEDGSAGIRVPMSDFCTRLIGKFRRPIVSTSANIAGEPTPSSFEEISPKIKGGVDHIVAQFCEKDATGAPSQIIKVGVGSEIEIIRG